MKPHVVSVSFLILMKALCPVKLVFHNVGLKQKCSHLVGKEF